MITPTEAVARGVRDILGPSAPVVAVHSGVSVTPSPPDASRRTSALGIPGRYILFVGTAEPRKGLDVLVAAMKHQDLERFGLVVVGPPGLGERGC